MYVCFATGGKWKKMEKKTSTGIKGSFHTSFSYSLLTLSRRRRGILKDITSASVVRLLKIKWRRQDSAAWWWGLKAWRRSAPPCRECTRAFSTKCRRQRRKLFWGNTRRLTWPIHLPASIFPISTFSAIANSSSHPRGSANNQFHQPFDIIHCCVNLNTYINKYRNPRYCPVREEDHHHEHKRES